MDLCLWIITRQFLLNHSEAHFCWCTQKLFFADESSESLMGKNYNYYIPAESAVNTVMVHSKKKEKEISLGAHLAMIEKSSCPLHNLSHAHATDRNWACCCASSQSLLPRTAQDKSKSLSRSAETIACCCRCWLTIFCWISPFCHFCTDIYKT